MNKEPVTTDRQADLERVAREWLSENIGPCDIDSELNESLAALLSAQRKAVLGEVRWQLQQRMQALPPSVDQELSRAYDLICQELKENTL